MYLLNEYLPQEILDYIFDFVQNIDKVFVSKLFYKKYHYLIKNKIKSASYEKYIRFTITKNLYFTFEHIINENYRRWIRMKRYRYKDMEFSNYIEFLKFYCNENKSIQCFNILISFLNTKNRKFIQAISLYSNLKSHSDELIFDITNQAIEPIVSKHKINRNIVYKNYHKL